MTAYYNEIDPFAAWLRELIKAGRTGSRPSQRAADARATNRPGPTNGFWRDADWLYFGPYLASIKKLPCSSDTVDRFRAKIDRMTWGDVPPYASKYVDSFEEGMAWCEGQIDELIRDLKRDRSKKPTQLVEGDEK